MRIIPSATALVKSEAPFPPERGQRLSAGIGFGAAETEAYRAEKAAWEKRQRQVCSTIYYEDDDNKVSGLDVLRALKAAGYQRLYNPFVLLDLHSWGEKTIFSTEGDGYSQYVTQKHVLKKLLKQMKNPTYQLKSFLDCAVTLALRDLERQKLITSAPFDHHFLDNWHQRLRPLAAANQILKSDTPLQSQPFPFLWQVIPQLKQTLGKLEIRRRRLENELAEKENLLGKDCVVYQGSKWRIECQTRFLNQVSWSLNKVLEEIKRQTDSPLLHPPKPKQYLLSKYLAHDALVVHNLADQMIETADPPSVTELIQRIKSL